MLANRSMPRCHVIPELAYPDVGRAVDWLCETFGFTLRLQIANHRAQLNVGDGAIVVTERRVAAASALSSAVDGPAHGPGHAVMIRIDDVDRHFDRANRHGARILNPPTTYAYGERQYTVEDYAGHRWTFSESVADIDPATWGGVAGEL